MLLVRFIRFWLGYICIYVEGDYPERFLNLCVQSGYKVFNTKRRAGNFEFCIFARDYRQIRHFRRKCGVRYKIKYRRGMPFIVRRYRRSGLAVGAAMFVTMLTVMPQFVWSINISGNAELSQQQISSALETVGISIGTPLKDVDADNMRLRLALLLPEISWASINIDGTAVNVDLRETNHKSETDTKFSNLVADFDGVITAVYVRSGSAAVKVGDSVVKGELLVSGTEEYKDGKTVFRHSDADIIATVNRTVTVKIPTVKTVSNDISCGTKRTVLSLFGCEIPLYIGGIGFEHRAEYTEQPLCIGGVTLPVIAHSATFYEIEQRDIMLTEADALQEAEAVLQKEQQTLFGNFTVIACEIKIDRAESYYTVTADYTLSGNIARTEYLQIELEK